MRTLSCREAIRPFFCFLLLGSFATIAGLTQALPKVQSRITKPIDEASLVTLDGNTLELAQQQFDRGPISGATSADRLMLILRRSLQQEIDLQSYLQSVQNPDSPEFRKFLTPEEFGRRYGPSDADLARIEQWLRGHGFSVAGVNKGRTEIEFSGNVGQIQQTFHTSIHKFNLGGEEHWANVSDPLIPAALGPVVAGVASLNDVKPRSHFVMGPSAKWDAQLHRFLPDLTINSGGSNYLLVGPGDAATIYNSPNSFNTKLASNQTTYDGTGVTIGIAGTTFLYDSGPFYYQSLFGLSTTLNGPVSVYDGNLSNMSQAADETEAVLDTEVAGGLAPGAFVFYYGAGDTEFQSGLFLSIYRAIDDNKVGILSVSYGECEKSLGTAGNLQVLNAWEQAAAQGITVVVSSGDAGSAGCDNPDTQTVAKLGLAVNGLASTPYDIAVGGSDFDVLSKSFSTYVSATDGANYTSALSYIPENPWNDSTATNGLLTANTPDTSANNIIAGGGGASSLGAGSQATQSLHGSSRLRPATLTRSATCPTSLCLPAMASMARSGHCAWIPTVPTARIPPSMEWEEPRPQRRPLPEFLPWSIRRWERQHGWARPIGFFTSWRNPIRAHFTRSRPETIPFIAHPAAPIAAAIPSSPDTTQARPTISPPASAAWTRQLLSTIGEAMR